MGGIKPDFLDTDDIFASVDTTAKTGAPEAPDDIFASVDIGTNVNGAPTVKPEPTTGIFARAPGRRPVDASQNTAVNLMNYYDNRADDVVNSVIDAAEGTYGLFKDPHATAGFVKNAVKGVAGMVANIPAVIEKNGLKRAIMTEFGEKMIWDPLQTFVEHIVVTPVNTLLIHPAIIAMTGSMPESEDEARAATRAAVPDVIATIVGAKVGLAIAERQLASNAAGRMAAQLSINPATAAGKAELLAKLAAMPTDEIIAMSKDLPTMMKVQQTVTRAIAEGTTGGVAAGLTMPGTPEEKFNNAFQMAVMGVPFVLGIHGTFKALNFADGVISGKVSPEQIVRQAATEQYRNIQVRRLMDLPPSERFAAGQHFLDGVDASEVIMRNTDRGIVYNIPLDVKSRLGDNGVTYYDHGDGTFSALVDKTKVVEDAAYQTHPEGVEARAASATATADEVLMKELEISNPEMHAQIDKLRASGQTEAAESLMRAMDQRDFMRRELFKDPLTGIANRRALDLALPKAEADPNVHVFVSDLDNFKSVNDTHGHLVGDAAIKAFGEHVRGIMEKYHLPVRDVFRYGGDEFVTFIRSPDKLILERIKAEIDAFKFVAESEGKPPTEIKSSTGAGPNLHSADKAMYEIKGYKKGGPVPKTPIQESSAFFSDADRAHFKATGFVPYQKVSFNGKDWFVSKVAGKTAQLIDAEGNTVSVETKAIRRTPQLEVATPHLPDIDALLKEPIDPETAPKEPGFKRTIDDAKQGFKAELIKPVDGTDIRAKSQPKQPAYSLDPDVNAVQKGFNGLEIEFASDFDKAVWQIIRTEGEMKNLDKKGPRKLQIETRMMQLAKKVGIPVKELIAHKGKLMNEVAKTVRDMQNDLRGIGEDMLDPKNGSLGIGVGAIPFDGVQSKFMGIDWNKVGNFVNAGKFTELLNPEEKAIVEGNKEAYRKYNEDMMKGVLHEINDNGYTVHVNGSSVDVVGPDGKVAASFKSIDEALEFKMQGNNPPNNGMSSIGSDQTGVPTNNPPPADLGGGDGSNGGSPPPNGGNIPDNGYFDYDKPNWMNKLVGGAQQARAELGKPRQGYLRDLAAQYGLPDIGIAGMYLDRAALEANSLTVRYRSQIQQILKSTAKMNMERLRHLGANWLKTGSEAEYRSNRPGMRLDITRPTTDVEFSKGAEIARLAQAALQDGETALDPLYRVSKFVTGLKKLSKDYPSEKAKQSSEYIHQMSQLEAFLKEDPATQKLLVALNEIISMPKSVADIYQVIALAEAELTKSLDKGSFAEVNKMTPQELNVVKQMQQFINERAVEQGMDGPNLVRKMDMAGRYNGGTYEGSIFSLQEGANANESAFMSQLVRDIDNVDFQKDPFSVMHNLANTTVRNRILRPAREAFLEKMEEAGRDIRAKGVSESLRRGDTKETAKYNAQAEKMLLHTKAYADEVVGKMMGRDAQFNDAFNSMSNWFAEQYRKARKQEPMKPGEEFDVDVKRELVGPLNRWFEIAAQGGKIAAGVMDLTYGMIKTWSIMPFDRWLKMIQVGAKSIDQAAELQKQGKIAGLQAIVPEDLSTVRTSTTGLNIRNNFEAASDVAFSLSGQPAVFKYLSASLWVENLGAMSKAIKKFDGATSPESAAKVREELGTRILGPANNIEIQRLLVDGQQEAAAEYYARAMQHAAMVQYGRANHPEGFGNVIGRLAGTFGSWGFGAMDSFLQPYQYGTFKEAGVHTAKVVAAYWAFKKIQDDTGLNMRRYMFNPFDWATWRGGPLVGVGGSLADWGYAKTSGNQRKLAEAEWQLRNYLPNGKKNASIFERARPFDPKDDNWGSILVPGSMALQNSREAFEELTQGHFVQAGLRGIGIRPLK